MKTGNDKIRHFQESRNDRDPAALWLGTGDWGLRARDLAWIKA
jgi:hypothetical protein